jgi:hypothetical protein
MSGTYDPSMTLDQIIQTAAPHLPQVPPDRNANFHRYTLAWILAKHVNPEELRRLLTPSSDAPLTSQQRLELATLIVEQAEAVATKGDAHFGFIDFHGLSIWLVDYAIAVMKTPEVIQQVQRRILGGLLRGN